MRFLFAHGWGFDAGFWDPLRAALGDPAGDAEDRGYFGAPRRVAIDGPYVAVGHSLGAMRLLLRHPGEGRGPEIHGTSPAALDPGLRRDDDTERCIGIVAINGFDRFCGTPGIAPRVVDRMIARLAREPVETVRDFRHRCGDDGAFGAPDPAPLAADLALLRDGDARGSIGLPLLVLHGGRDPILTAEHRAATFAGHARETHLEAGHLLPLTHPKWCAARISEWLRR